MRVATNGLNALLESLCEEIISERRRWRDAQRDSLE
jgi:hypothetical protein